MKSLTLFLILLIHTTFMAQNIQQPTVDVAGEGIVTVVPDQVTVNVRVENTGKNAKELKQQNDIVVNDVLQFIKTLGIDNRNVSTDYVRLSKNYEYNTKTYNFAANQSISIKLKDLKKYESLMDGLMASGINRIDGISFSSSKKKNLEAQARKNAIQNAKMKAEEYANVLNQSIGKAIAISEFRATNTPQTYLRSAVAMEADMSGGQTLAPGEMEIKVTVNVSFLLN